MKHDSRAPDLSFEERRAMRDSDGLMEDLSRGGLIQPPAPWFLFPPRPGWRFDDDIAAEIADWCNFHTFYDLRQTSPVWAWRAPTGHVVAVFHFRRVFHRPCHDEEFLEAELEAEQQEITRLTERIDATFLWSPSNLLRIIMPHLSCEVVDRYYRIPSWATLWISWIKEHERQEES